MSIDLTKYFFYKKFHFMWGCLNNVEQDVMTLYYDNVGTFNISKNYFQHSRIKHIGHHFIRELFEDKVVNLYHIATK